MPPLTPCPCPCPCPVPRGSLTRRAGDVSPRRGARANDPTTCGLDSNECFGVFLSGD
ncbi:MAG: hypothetical protein AB7K09_24980 [Planctomycetota bacterium]